MRRTVISLGITEAADPQKALAGFESAEGRIWSDDADGVVAVVCPVAARMSGRGLDEDAGRHLEGIPFVVAGELRGSAAGVLDRVGRPGDDEWCGDGPEGLADGLGRLAWYRASLGG